MFEDELMSRITIDPTQCGRHPCVRGMRVRVVDVLELLASGMDFDQVLSQLPDLEPDDIRACLVYTANRMKDG